MAIPLKRPAASIPNAAASIPNTVALIGTGGTIAGAGEDATRPFAYECSQSGIDTIVQRLGLGGRVQPLRFEQPFNTGSEDFTEAHWRTLARRVQALADDPGVAGVVLTQGTDTLEETAYFLNLVLKVRKPVVITGAMRPTTALGSDAALNLVQAIALARSPAAADLGVLVLMNDRIHGARQASKLHTWALDSFQSPESGPLGCMLGDQALIHHRPTRRHTVHSALALQDTPLPRVDLLWAFAGIDPGVVHDAVDRGALGLVYAGTGNGSIAAPLKAPIAAAVRAGVAVVRASRVPCGVVVAQAAEDDDALGTVAAGSLSAVKARVLLQLALAQGLDRSGIQQLFDTH
jgi:L-asparaginase